MATLNHGSATVSEAIVLDTHRFVKRLTEKGFTEAQAEDSNLATKQNLLETKSDLERQIAAVRGDVLVLQWMVGLVIVVQIIPLPRSLF